MALSSDSEESADVDGAERGGWESAESRYARRCEDARIMSLRLHPPPRDRPRVPGRRGALPAISAGGHAGMVGDPDAWMRGRRFWGAVKGMSSTDDDTLVVPGERHPAENLAVAGPDTSSRLGPLWAAVRTNQLWVLFIAAS